MYMKKNTAFTLVELLVVIAIISILSTVMLIGSQGYLARARDSERITDLSQIRIALELYFNACRQYPATLSTSANNGCPTGITFGSFMSVIPTGNPSYGYAVNSGRSQYVLQATLEQVSRELDDDLDGTILSLPCDDTVGTLHYYCLQS